MGCGQSVATHVCTGPGPIYEMTFDMTSTSSPPLATSLSGLGMTSTSSPPLATSLSGLGVEGDDGQQGLQRIIDCLPGDNEDVMRMPGRLVRVMPLPPRASMGS
jgi:hypothetical protein